MFKRPTKSLTTGLLTCIIVLSVSSALRQVKSKEVTYIRLNRVAALNGTSISRASRELGWGIGARNNSTGIPEDGQEQDREDGGDTVEHHLGEKTI